MKPNDLAYANLTTTILAPYNKRASTDSAKFLRWFLENIFRQEKQQADDASVDAKHDKGIDGILVNNVLEIVYVIQVKVRQPAKATLGDTDLKEFLGTLKQFETAESVQKLAASTTNEKLKATLEREKISEKISSGYSIEGVFACNIPLNKDGKDFLQHAPDIEVFDSNRICAEFVDLDAASGIEAEFEFDTSNSEVIKYQTSDGIETRMFLAEALHLLHMKGISDGSLFARNVRLSLGNTKVNKSLIQSIKKKDEHKNFPLYHNGITVICTKIIKEDAQKLKVSGYMVVNGAQSLSSLMHTRSSLSADLKILVRVVAIGGSGELTHKITQNSNNQNAINARDLKSNAPIQERLKKEVEIISGGKVVYEVKRGESNPGREVISNEDAGLALLAMDLGEPWSCHQKYKVMDESHAKIFGRPDVDGYKVLVLTRSLAAVEAHLDDFDDSLFGHYSLTKYLLSYCVCEIIKSDDVGKRIFNDFKGLVDRGRDDLFVSLFSDLAGTTVDDINAEVAAHGEGVVFDYKRDLKSPNWCRSLREKIKAAYLKDVKRKKANPISEVFKDCLLPTFPSPSIPSADTPQ